MKGKSDLFLNSSILQLIVEIAQDFSYAGPDLAYVGLDLAYVGLDLDYVRQANYLSLHVKRIWSCVSEI